MGLCEIKKLTSKFEFTMTYFFKKNIKRKGSGISLLMAQIPRAEVLGQIKPATYFNVVIRLAQPGLLSG